MTRTLPRAAGRCRLRLAAGMGLTVLLAVGALGAPRVPGGAGPAAGAPVHVAGVIIETGERTWRTVIRFSEEEITGVQALVLAGADPVTYSYAGLGAAVCALHGVGRAAGPNCLGGADSDPRYWAYFRAPAGTGRFEYSRTGAGATRVRDGDVEGWRWGTGQAPTFVPLDRIGAPAPTTTTRPPATTRPAAPAPPAGPADPGGSPQPPGSGVPAPPGPQAPGGEPPEVSPAVDPDAGSGDAARVPDDGSTRLDRRDRRARVPDTGGDGAGSDGAATGRIGRAPGGEGTGGGPPLAGYAAFAGLLAAIGAGIVTARRRRGDAERPVP